MPTTLKRTSVIMLNSGILSWRWAILGAVVIVLAGGIWVVRNGWPGGALTGMAASEQAPVPVAQLMAPGALPDVWLGSKDAPVPAALKIAARPPRAHRGTDAGKR